MDVPPDAEQLAELRSHFLRHDAKINKLRAEQKEREATIARLLDECCSCPHDDDDSDDVKVPEEPEPVSYESPPDLPDLDSMWLHLVTLGEQLDELKEEKELSEARMEKLLARRCCCYRGGARCADVFLEKKKKNPEKAVSKKEEVLRKRLFKECVSLYERLTVRMVLLERRLHVTPFAYGGRYPPRIMDQVCENFTARELDNLLSRLKWNNYVLYYDELMHCGRVATMRISETIDSVKKRVGRAKERLQEKLTIKRVVALQK